MSIHIIDNAPDIYLTRDEHEHLQREYQQFVMFNADPPTFEGFVRMRRRYSERSDHGSVENPANPWSQS